MKSAGLSVKTSKISLSLTKYIVFCQSNIRLAKITEITMITYRTVQQNWVLSCKKTAVPGVPDSCPAAEKMIS